LDWLSLGLSDVMPSQTHHRTLFQTLKQTLGTPMPKVLCLRRYVILSLKRRVFHDRLKPQERSATKSMTRFSTPWSLSIVKKS
jgi:hypothetical protein